MPSATTRTPISIKEFEANAGRLAREVARTREAVPVDVDGKSSVVLLDLDTYHDYIHLINLARALLEGEADIRAGRTRPLDEVMNELLGGNHAPGRAAPRRRKRPAGNP